MGEQGINSAEQGAKIAYQRRSRDGCSALGRDEHVADPALRGPPGDYPSDREGRMLFLEAARRYLRKDARVNIRLSSADLEMLKRRAAEEGPPYQSLIASILHKYVSGSVTSGSKGG